MPTFESITVAGGDFKTRVWRAGSGQPLLFLHGFEGHPGDAPFLERLAERHQVFAPEHPGFGETTGIERIDDVVDIVMYYNQLAETLGLAQADVIGHSLGGMFAAELAAITPQLVRRLVLVSPFGLWLENAPIPDLFAMSPGQFNRSIWHDPESPAAKEAVARLADGKSGVQATVTRAANLGTAGKFLWPIPDRGLRKRLPRVKAPTLVVMGGADKLIPAAYGEAFAQIVPNARVETIPAAGHLPMIEQPDAFIQAVEPFLAG